MLLFGDVVQPCWMSLSLQVCFLSLVQSLGFMFGIEDVIFQLSAFTISSQAFWLFCTFPWKNKSKQVSKLLLVIDFFYQSNGKLTDNTRQIQVCNNLVISQTQNSEISFGQSGTNPRPEGAQYMDTQNVTGAPEFLLEKPMSPSGNCRDKEQCGH